MKGTLFLLNNFAHDFFTGLWLCAFLVLAIIERHNTGAPAAAESVLQPLENLFFWLQHASLLLIGLTGFLRYLDTKHGYSAAASDGVRKRVLVIKHVLLGVLFIGGTMTAILWR